MRKSLSMLVMESEKEYKITMKSAVNIHDVNHLDRIKSALMGHRVGKVEATEIIPFTGKADKDLPEAPVGTQVYVVEIVISLPMSESEMIQLIALYTGIEPRNFALLGDIEKEEITEEIEEEVKSAQKDVGQKRLDDFMDELKSARKEREKEIEAVKPSPITEAFCTSAIEIRNLLENVVVGKGYWMVRPDGEQKSATITGPYEDIPMGVSLVEGATARSTPMGVTAINHGDLMEYRVSFRESLNLRESGMRPFQVRVKDTNTGRTYTVAVDARDSLNARNAAMDKVETTERIPRDSLLALNPT